MLPLNSYGESFTITNKQTTDKSFPLVIPWGGLLITYYKYGDTVLTIKKLTFDADELC